MTLINICFAPQASEETTVRAGSLFVIRANTISPSLTTPFSTNEGMFADWDIIAPGDLGCFAIRNGKLYGLGQTPSGNFSTTTFQRIGSADDWVDVEIGSQHAVGIRNGQLYAWGLNNHARLGLGNNNGLTYSTPQPVNTPHSDWSRVGAGVIHSVAIRNGTMYSWGAMNAGLLDFGQLGRAASSDHSSSIAASKPSEVQYVADGTSLISFSGVDAFDVGPYSNSAIINGKLFLWGDGRQGQLGIGSRPYGAYYPTRVGTGTNWSDCGAQFNNSCGILNGELYCWGSNTGNLTDYTSGQYTTTPNRLGTASNWDKCDISQDFGYAIRGDQLYRWGGFTSFSIIQVSSATSWFKISASEDIVLGLRD